MSENSSETSAVLEFKDEVRGVSLSEIVKRVHSGVSTVHCKELDLNRQEIGDDDVSELCGVLNRFTALAALWLAGNDITSVGVSALCNVLSVCEKLSGLNLTGNSIDDIGAKLIAETLPKTNLEELWISYNSIGRDGIRALLLSAANSTTLKELYINGNSGVVAAVADIVEILPHCRTLKILALGFEEEDLNEEFRQRIRSAMSQCSTQLTVEFAVGVVDGEEVSGAAEIDGTLLEWIHDTATFHREFLAAMQRHGSIRVYRSRVSLVGDSKAGKTWTAKSLRGEPNYHPHSVEQLERERTAAAESTALYIGDFMVGGVDLRRQSAVDDDTAETFPGSSASDVVTLSGESSTQISSTVLTDTELQLRTGPVVNGRRTELCKVNDKIRNFRFPQQICDEYEIDADKSVCYLTLWDFGGQLMYHSWYQFFFAPGMIPCVVFDLSLLLTATHDRGENDGISTGAKAMVDRIVHYAQQSLHFGGPDCRVLLVGTKAEAAARLLVEREEMESTAAESFPTLDQRARAAAKAFNMIVAASPELSQDRYYVFQYVDGSDLNLSSASDLSGPPYEINRRLCAVENERSMTDLGVKTLSNSLISESIRPRALDHDAVSEGRTTRNTNTHGGEDQDEDFVAPDIRTARESLRNNELPRHWYEFELDLRDNPRWKLRHWCTVRQLRSHTTTHHKKIANDFEFLALLSSMASAGDVILTENMPWRLIESSGAVPERFKESLVIVRPQWLIEVGRTLLPRPHETQEEYLSRLRDSLPNIPNLSRLVGRLWQTGIVGCDLLSAVFSGTPEMEESQLVSLINLFENRQILCRIDTGTSGVQKGQWFVPSMVVFHAEHSSPGIGTVVKERRDSHIQLRMSFSWVPPGYPLLVVGSLLQGVSTQPQFSLRHESGLIQFAVTYLGNASFVYIDLPRGAAGDTMIVWTPLSLQAKTQRVVQTLLHRLLEAVCAACRRLRVEPLLEEPFETAESGLIIDIGVPAVPNVESDESPQHMVNLVDLCRSGADIPREYSASGTKTMYKTVLAGVQCMSISDDLLAGLEV